MRLVLLGPPGAGKGTQAKQIQERYDLVHISTGEAFRHIQSDPQHPLAKQVSLCVTKGNLLPDDVVMQVVKQRLQQSDCQKGYVLDGFPRTVEQAQLLQQFLVQEEQQLSCVLSFEVSCSTLMKRLSNRLTCPECGTSYRWQGQQIPPGPHPKCDKDDHPLVRREDDEPQAIRRRLQVFDQQTAPVKAFYSGCGLLHCVNAEGDVENVWRQLQQQLERVGRSRDLASATKNCYKRNVYKT
ncbi:MAG: adenylate kinase [Myxococcota bacterium]